MRGPGPVRAARPPSPPDTPPPPPPSPSRPSRLWPARPSSTPAARHAAAALSVVSPGHVARAGPLSGLVTWPAGRPRPTHPTRLSPSSRPSHPPRPRSRPARSVPSEIRVTAHVRPPSHLCLHYVFPSSRPLVMPSPSSRRLFCFIVTSPRHAISSVSPSRPLATSSGPLICFIYHVPSSRPLICFLVFPR